MKYLHLILGASLIAQLHGLDSGQLAEVSKKFALESGDDQYAARMELNKLVDEATAPGKNQIAEVNKLLIEALGSAETPDEAKKYILRVLSRTATAENIPAMKSFLGGSDPLLQEEARRAIECIPSSEAAAALGAALADIKDPNERIGVLNSLATQKAAGSATAIRSLILDPNPEISRAAVNALGRIGGAESTEILKSAYVSPKVNPATKANLERALLYASATDSKAAALVFKSTSSDALRLAAYQSLVAGDLNAEKSALLEQGLKSESDAIRHTALKQGLQSSLPSLQAGLAQGIDQLPPADRLVVLANLHQLKSSDAAEKIATSLIDSSDEGERVAALNSLGHFKTSTAFVAVLRALGERKPRINRAAGSALSGMDFDGGEALLAKMIEGDSSEDRILAIKALNYRQVSDANALLLGVLSSADKAAAQEAMKSLYASATIDDLAKLCEAAGSASDGDTKKQLTSLCKKIASRLKSDEANKLVEGIE
ncbi:HEAT repeat domain-containing protein [Haloferula sp.]|uniref:HEAT repeat domain-containing protein n=1 Tax=Haloferula sp. TaxID=2497595 RepID=UPI00329E86B5